MALYEDGLASTARELVFEELDELLGAERFTHVEAIMHQLPVSRIVPLDLLLAFVMKTNSVKEKMRVRPRFVEAIRLHLHQDLSYPPERISAILDRYA